MAQWVALIHLCQKVVASEAQPQKSRLRLQSNNEECSRVKIDIFLDGDTSRDIGYCRKQTQRYKVSHDLLNSTVAQGDK